MMLPEGYAPVLEVIHDRSLTKIFIDDGELTPMLCSSVEVSNTGVQPMVVEDLALTTGSTGTSASP